MAKDVGQAHGLHQLMRSWLLAEDPYGLNQRQEPTFGTQSPPGAPPAPGGAGSAPSAPATATPGDYSFSQPVRANEAGTSAVAKALRPSSSSESGRNAAVPDRASMAGTSAVDKAINAPNPGAVRYSEAPRSDRAQAWGERAVEGAAQPQPLDMSGAPGYASPEEAQMTAQAVGRGAVAGALQPPTGDAIRAKAKKRLKDPQDPDDRQPE